MPGIYQNIPIFTIPVASWGAAYTGVGTVTNLWQGNQAYPATAWSPTQVDAYRAYVLAGGVYYDIGHGWLTFSDYNPNTTQMEVTVSANLLGYCLQKGLQPTSCVIVPLVKVPHSNEETGGDLGENFPTAGTLGGSLDSVPSGGAGTAYGSLFVRTAADGGDDAHDGSQATPGAGLIGPLLTIQEACNRLMAMSPLKRSWLVDVGRGVFAGTVALEGLQLTNGARVWFIGAAPPATAALATLTNTAGVSTLAASARLHGMLRLTPNGADAWDAALTTAMIGSTIRFDGGGGEVAFATVANVQTGGPGAGVGYVDLSCATPLLGGAPVWITAIGTVATIIDHTDAECTSVTGDVFIGNIRCDAGSNDQAVTATEKLNLLGHIRFTNDVTLDSADRFDFHGSRFEDSVLVQNTFDCLSFSNAVNQAAADLYWPDAIWTRLGYTDVGTADAYGGCGYYADDGTKTYAMGFVGASGIHAGSVTPADVVISTGSNMGFSYMSHLGTTGYIDARNGGMVAIGRSRLNCMISSVYEGSWKLQDYMTWASHSNAADDTLANAPCNLGIGLMYVGHGSNGCIDAGAAAGRLEGRNDDHAGNVVVEVHPGGIFTAFGGHDANLYADQGWLTMAGATGYMDGDRTFPSKANAGAAFADIDIYNSRLTCSVGAADTWTKTHVAAAGDTTRSPFLLVRHHSDFKFGSPASGAPTGLIVVGATGAGNGCDCGALGTIRIENGSRVTIADFRINNDDGAAGNPAIIITNASFLHFTGENVNSYIERVGAAANAITQGSIATIGYVPTGEAAHRALYSDYLALIGTAQGTFINHE